MTDLLQVLAAHPRLDPVKIDAAAAARGRPLIHLTSRSPCDARREKLRILFDKPREIFLQSHAALLRLCHQTAFVRTKDFIPYRPISQVDLGDSEPLQLRANRRAPFSLLGPMRQLLDPLFQLRPFLPLVLERRMLELA